MITDNLSQVKRYSLPHMEEILKFISSHDCVNLPDGEMEVLGRDLFVRIMSYVPKPADENRFEIHRRHADLQYLASGSEKMQTTSIQDLTPLTEYDAKGDFQFYKPKGLLNEFIVKEGDFAVFYPTEAHRTSCAYSADPSPVKKLVFKIRMGP